MDAVAHCLNSKRSRQLSSELLTVPYLGSQSFEPDDQVKSKRFDRLTKLKIN